MSNIPMREVQKLINSCTSRDDLMILNKMLKHRFNILTQIEATAFMVGDVVAFKTKGGTFCEGVVQKVNRKTVSVKCGNIMWKVSPALLRVVKVNARAA